MNKPPKWLHQLLRWCAPASRPDLEGDFLEIYADQLISDNKLLTQLKWVYTCLTLLPLKILIPKEKQMKHNWTQMLSLYLKIGRREPRLSNSMRERIALNIMLLVAKAHRHADQRLNVESLSEALQIPAITLAPIAIGLEKNGLLAVDENEYLLPGREMARTRLTDILDVVRNQGETGSHRDPQWSPAIESLGHDLDSAIVTRIGDRSLSDLLDSVETGSASGHSESVDEE